MKGLSFRSLWVGQLLANLGDVFYVVGLISILYDITGSAFYLALLPFLTTFGHFLSGIIAPILINRVRLKFLLISSQAAKTMLLGGLMIGFQLFPALPILFVLGCIFLVAFLDGWALPATRAMLPRLVKEKELVKANSFISIMTETTQLGGWAFGGMLTAFIGGQQVVGLTFILFFIATIIMCLITDKTAPQLNQQHTSKMGELKEGWILIWRTPIFRSIHIMIVLESIANVVWVAAILYIFTAEILHVDESWWGYINTCFFTGLIIGGIICTNKALFIEKNMERILMLSSAGIVVITFCFGVNTVPLLALLLACLSGMAEQIKGIILTIYLQKEASNDNLPKIYSAQSALSSIVFGLASVVFGALADIINVQVIFIFASSILFISVIYLKMNQTAFSKG